MNDTVPISEIPWSKNWNAGTFPKQQSKTLHGGNSDTSLRNKELIDLSKSKAKSPYHKI